MEKKEFYAKCAELLDCENLYVDESAPIQKIDRNTGEKYQPMTKATRWGRREPGAGRFPDHGIIRVFNDTTILVGLINPKLNGTFDSFDAVLVAIKQTLEINSITSTS